MVISESGLNTIRECTETIAYKLRDMYVELDRNRREVKTSRFLIYHYTNFVPRDSLGISDVGLFEVISSETPVCKRVIASAVFVDADETLAKEITTNATRLIERYIAEQMCLSTLLEDLDKCKPSS